MKNSQIVHCAALACALLLACGAAQAQLKSPAKSQPKDPLGGGLYVPSAAPAAPAAAPVEEERSPDAIVQEIANCMVAPLPKGWALAQIEVTELGRGGGQREFEAKYSYVAVDGKDQPFSPCDLRGPAENVYKLNSALAPDKRDWTKATLVLSNDGKFELKYDYDAPKQPGTKK